ncbi:nickel/cobalt transporter [Mesorhizobium sp. M8A.F.Ca.ET.208.01.1.1]|uniref:nickel/cobalt transporter n=1 Tax=unclassified Mesorhizobium TaxID=325217 RepID=UPI00109411CF|nr:MULTISPECIES: nickel/cobalt transporter [unclassified Mesorhizobium]TGQ92306.1 nickel/cobalt transporter [Mesorhizobium sp. M8A.F.Ca.ET.208.01.1.1]TGT52208.1 nickel/cobalt transporter [Mesorhizobium sp. M8A.F.Ca.ET.167.01.1.1]
MNPVTKPSLRLAFGLLAIAFATMHFANAAHAQSSLGIGVNDGMAPSTGPFAHILMWINLRQQEFYRALATAMKAMRQDNSKLWVLIGLSFAYGIFHAAGPGHGKAVISSYMVANEVALRRGILLSFVSALLQGLTAVAVMAVAYFVLRGTAVSMTDAAWFMEIMSFVFVTLFGAWLLWRKLGPSVLRLFGRGPAYSLSAAHAGHSHAGHSHAGHSHGAHSHSHAGHAHAVHSHAAHSHAHDDHEHAHGHAHDHHDHGDHDHHHDHAHHDHAHHDHGASEVCETCGHSHAPDPAMLSGDRFDWRTAWSAVAAVGIRPCSGALIVLSFALLNGLWLGGLLSVLAMSIGTAITVSALATMAVTAKNWAVYFAGDGRMGNRIHSIVEIGGAAFVFLFGLLLLSASLTGGV